jgi:2-polyprenyl-3-methyl-5-hydroxy-6-metoxy-1,4-benzoquinol methylase
MSDVKCLICASKSSFLFKQNYTNQLNSNLTFDCNFYKCHNCEAVFIYPQPNSEIISSSYSSDYDCYNEKSEIEIKRYNSLKLKLAKWRFPEVLNVNTTIRKGLALFSEILTGKRITYTLGIPINLDSGAKVLEVGYGTGYWLKMMKGLNFENLNGFDIQNNTSYSNELIKMGITVKNDLSLDRINWNGKFNLIRLEHVFEHIPDPHGLCPLLFNLLEEKGVLVMTLPSIDSMVKKGNWLKISYDLDVPRHLFHYSKKSLIIILKTCGFKNIKVSNVPVFTNFLRNILIRANINETRLNGLFFRCLILLFSPLYFIICMSLNKGEFLSVKAEK